MSHVRSALIYPQTQGKSEHRHILETGIDSFRFKASTATAKYRKETQTP